MVEYDGEDSCFGLVAGSDVEAGYFSLSELEHIYEGLEEGGTIADLRRQGVIVLPIERDEGFIPARLSELRNLYDMPQPAMQWTTEP